jgi:outer membrane protein
MEKLCLLALIGACTAASAQTPAPNLMPDGSRDMFVGLGASSLPVYEGAKERRLRALPTLQIQWSNGVFVSGQSVGMHLSNQPSLEFGPLASLAPRRSESGTGSVIGTGASDFGATSIAPPVIGIAPPPVTTDVPAKISLAPGTTRLTGLEDISPRLEVGGFANITLAPSLRLTNSLLYGAGNDHKGLRWNIDLQRIAADVTPHHTVVLSAGLTVANSNYNQAYFGVSPAEARRSINPAYTASGGVKDVHAGLRWNWALGPSWLVSSGLNVSHLAGSAASSPLVERRTNISASSVLAYRF